jgi:rhamnosyltransferase subunit B
VAASTGVPWVSAVLQPMSFFSVHERPNYLPFAPLSWLCGRSPELHGKVFGYVRQHTERWLDPVLALRTELGIASRDHPLYEGQHSGRRVLAMFSPLLGARQPDWPAATVQTGTALYLDDAPALSDGLRRFLARNDAPLAVFTLGSAASNDAGDFYADGLAAASALGMRALLVTGGLAAASSLPEPLPEGALRIAYAPFEAVFPHAAVIVHSGGVATSFKALRAGRPQIIVPHAHDQMDNALRLRALGAALVLPRQRAGRHALRAALARAVGDERMRQAAGALAGPSRAEDGVEAGCRAIEEALLHG